MSHPNLTKQVLVIRKDLNMRKGKIAAQAAHASLNSFLMSVGCMKWRRITQIWQDSTYDKICVYVNSEQDLLHLFTECKENDIPCSLIEDLGKTEFNNVPTFTAIGIGPYWSHEIDRITGDLPLL